MPVLVQHLFKFRYKPYFGPVDCNESSSEAIDDLAPINVPSSKYQICKRRSEIWLAISYRKITVDTMDHLVEHQIWKEYGGYQSAILQRNDKTKKPKDIYQAILYVDNEEKIVCCIH